MASNVDIDDDLLAEARRVGGHRTNKAAVTEALEQYIERHKQVEMLNLFGTIEYYANYEPKKYREKR
jgi:Arc/MetJ family transcription regulator